MKTEDLIKTLDDSQIKEIYIRTRCQEVDNFYHHPGTHLFFRVKRYGVEFANPENLIEVPVVMTQLDYCGKLFASNDWRDLVPPEK